MFAFSHSYSYSERLKAVCCLETPLVVSSLYVLSVFTPHFYYLLKLRHLWKRRGSSLCRRIPRPRFNSCIRLSRSVGQSVGEGASERDLARESFLRPSFMVHLAERARERERTDQNYVQLLFTARSLGYFVRPLARESDSQEIRQRAGSQARRKYRNVGAAAVLARKDSSRANPS